MPKKPKKPTHSAKGYKYLPERPRFGLARKDKTRLVVDISNPGTNIPHCWRGGRCGRGSCVTCQCCTSCNLLSRHEMHALFTWDGVMHVQYITITPSFSPFPSLAYTEEKIKKGAHTLQMRARMSSSTIPAVSGPLPKRRKSSLASIDATRKMYQSERRMDATVFEFGDDGNVRVGHGCCV